MPAMERKPAKRPTGPILATLLIILIVSLFLGWGYFTGKFPLKPTSQEPGLEAIRPADRTAEKEAGPSEKIPSGEGDLGSFQPEHVETVPITTVENQCQETADKIQMFFEHLDRQNYIREHSIKGSTLDYFKGIVSKLIANPPVVIRETDDLFAILNNMAHFFRILGAKDVMLVKDILEHEREVIEPTLALFYRWSELENECKGTEEFPLPLPGLYEYAGYFINTLGGQAYLFRREVYLRHLLRYYSILIIDRANRAEANRYGIDIRYTLDSLIAEMQENGGLVDQQAYLELLYKIQRKYQAEWGAKQ